MSTTDHPTAPTGRLTGRVNGHRPVARPAWAVGGHPVPTGPTTDHPTGPDHQPDPTTDRRSDRAMRRLELADRKRAAKRAARADREADRAARADQRRADRARKWSARADRARAIGETLRPIVPLLMVNTAAVYGQWDYLYEEGVEYGWSAPVRATIATVGAFAAETVSLYVGWHAHDALIHKAHRTARNLRRWSYAIAAGFAAVNYSHFAEGVTSPTAIAVLLGAFTLLSPWLWGLHTRRAQHLQLLAEGAPIDAGGAVFAPERVRAFPVRSWAARRWSIDYGVTDPLAAWEGYRAYRDARQTGRVRVAWAALCGQYPTSRPPTRTVPTDHPTTDRVVDHRPLKATIDRADRPTTRPAAGPTTRPVVKASEATTQPVTPPTTRPPTRQSTTDHPTGGRPKTDQGPTTQATGTRSGDHPTARATTPTATATVRPATPTTNRAVVPAAVANAAELRRLYPAGLPTSDRQIRTNTGWSADRVKAARAVYEAGADLPTTDREAAS